MDAVLEEECECTIDESGTVHLTTKASPARAAGTTRQAGSTAEAAALRERRQSHAAASTSAAGAHGGESSESSGGRAPYSWLTPQQQEVRMGCAGLMLEQ